MNKIFNKLNNNLFKIGDNYVCISDEKLKYGDTWIYVCPVNGVINSGDNDEMFALNTIPDSWNWFEKLYDKENYKKVIFSTQFIHESIPILNIEDIKLLQQPKEIISIEVEYEAVMQFEKNPEFYGTFQRNTRLSDKLKPIILPNGKIKCKINY